MYYIETQRGAPVLVHEGYQYTKEKEVNGKIYWRCRYRNCCGRVTVLKDLDEMWMKTDHNHTSENELVECGILIAMAKKRAREDETATLDQIVYETVSIVENKEKVLESLPSKAALKQRLKRSRNKSANKTTTSSSPDVIYLD